MKPETEGKIKYGVWGVVVGAVIAMIIGFAWGGWTTSTTAQKQSDKAVLASQSSICVAQFVRQSNYTENLKAFENQSSWDRSKLIEKGGWDKMPGQEKADYGVSRACADGLEKIINAGT
jgi:hypothetical protein